MIVSPQADWLDIRRGDAPLIVAFPHTGTDIPDDIAAGFHSLWHARRDADWWVHLLYAFVHEMGATSVRTRISRSVIDVNRNPSGQSLYPGQATTELCPTTDFDGAALYRDATPDAREIERRRVTWFDPYHQALENEVARLRAIHPHIVVYDAHSIRSHIPRLFAGELPSFNIGTNDGATCEPALAAAVESVCAGSGRSYVRDGRFKGGWTTRHYGRPTQGVHAIQMELAQRGYMHEPDELTTANWPTAMQPDPAMPQTLRQVIQACLTFAKGRT